MKSVAILAVSSLLAPAFVAAVPLEKRGVHTVTEYTTTTITITYTLQPGEVFTGLPDGFIPGHVAADVTEDATKPTDEVEYDVGPDDIDEPDYYVPDEEQVDVEPVAEPVLEEEDVDLEPVEEFVPEPVEEFIPEPVEDFEEEVEEVVEEIGEDVEVIEDDFEVFEPEPAPEPEPQASSGGNVETFVGDATFYVPGLGSCGFESGPSDFIVAVSKELFDQFTPNGNPNNNPLCGKQITINHLGKETVCTIADRCEGCAYGDIDLTQPVFDEVTQGGDGRVPDVKWSMELP